MNTESSDPQIQALRQAFIHVYDPEFGVSVQDLGLIYEIRIEQDVAFITMTLTSMYCPAGDVIMEGVKAAAEAVPGIATAEIDLVFEPTWTPELLSADARKSLGWDEPRIGA
jgi:metal-sulfur cluster biosynthetic enzyme